MLSWQQATTHSCNWYFHHYHWRKMKHIGEGGRGERGMITYEHMSPSSNIKSHEMVYYLEVLIVSLFDINITLPRSRFLHHAIMIFSSVMSISWWSYLLNRPILNMHIVHYATLNSHVRVFGLAMIESVRGYYIYGVKIDFLEPMMEHTPTWQVTQWHPVKSTQRLLPLFLLWRCSLSPSIQRGELARYAFPPFTKVSLL